MVIATNYVTQNVIAYSLILPWRYELFNVTKSQAFICGKTIKGFTDIPAAQNPLSVFIRLIQVFSVSQGLLALLTLSSCLYNISRIVIYRFTYLCMLYLIKH